MKKYFGTWILVHLLTWDLKDLRLEKYDGFENRDSKERERERVFGFCFILWSIPLIDIKTDPDGFQDIPWDTGREQNNLAHY